MLPRSLLNYSREGEVAIPDYLDAGDHPWLRALIDEYDRFAGRSLAELRQRLREPITPAGPARRSRRAACVLGRLYRDERKPAIDPVSLRRELFVAAAERDPAEVLAAAAAARKLSEEKVRAALFADLPCERRLRAPGTPVTPAELALTTNLALVQSFLRRATRVRIEISGNTRRLVQRARARGLLCVVRAAGGPGHGAVLDISGPLSLFRKTLVYGRALASLVSALDFCPRYRLCAACDLDVPGVPTEIRDGDPIARAKEPRRFDSKLEERFARDFARAAPDWRIVREPEPVSTPGGLIFPDFCLEHRRTQRRFLLEIVGFWTPEYLQRKLTALRAARIENLIVCIDAQRDCGPPTQGGNLGTVVRYRRRIDPETILRLIAP